MRRGRVRADARSKTAGATAAAAVIPEPARNLLRLIRRHHQPCCSAIDTISPSPMTGTDDRP
jgi:hypothetical protein